MRETWTFHSAGQLLFGRNASRQLGEVVRRLRRERVLIVTDPVLSQGGSGRTGAWADSGSGHSRQGFRRRRAGAVDSRGRGVHRRGRALPARMSFSAWAAAATWTWPKSPPPCSPTPADRAISVGDDRIPGPVWPLICVPTTAGTGSEVSAAAVLTDTENQMKVGILSNYLRPTVAVVDPLLTVGCPPKVTADSGIDALTHAIEAYTAVDNAEFPLPAGERTVYQGKHPLGDCLAEKAIQLIGKFLRRAVAKGDDLEARDGMALGATLAGLAFSNVGVALVHAMEYPGRRCGPLLPRSRQRPAAALRDAVQPASTARGVCPDCATLGRKRGWAGQCRLPRSWRCKRWKNCVRTSAFRAGCAT